MAAMKAEVESLRSCAGAVGPIIMEFAFAKRGLFCLMFGLLRSNAPSTPR
jgi:hypothetical protein